MENDAISFQVVILCYLVYSCSLWIIKFIAAL